MELSMYIKLNDIVMLFITLGRQSIFWWTLFPKDTVSHRLSIQTSKSKIALINLP